MLKITASLLGSWNYMFQVDDMYQEQAYESFLDTINGIRTPPNEFMQNGIDFENLAINGQIPIISETIKGGQFQVYAEKIYEIDGMTFKLLGYLDVLKAGIIYDIKRVVKYEYPKYSESYQHWCYMALVPESYKFRYLIGAGYSKAPYDDKVEIITHEEYLNDGTADDRVIEAIRQFISWLKQRDLFETYVKNYTIKEKK